MRPDIMESEFTGGSSIIQKNCKAVACSNPPENQVILSENSRSITRIYSISLNGEILNGSKGSDSFSKSITNNENL